MKAQLYKEFYKWLDNKLIQLGKEKDDYDYCLDVLYLIWYHKVYNEKIPN